MKYQPRTFNIFGQAFLILLVFLIFPVCAESAEISFREDSGDIAVSVIPETGADFGKVRPDGKKAIQLTLSNNSAETILFGDWSSPLQCLEFEDAPESMAPGSRTEIRMLLDCSGYGGEFSRFVPVAYSREGGEEHSLLLPVKFHVMADGEKDGAGDPAPVRESRAESGQVSYLDSKDIMKDGEKDLPDPASLDAWIFGSRDCPVCNYLKRNVLPDLFKNTGSSAPSRIITADLDQEENLLLLLKIEEALGVKGSKTPVLYWHGRLYYGAEEIKRLAAGEIKSPAPPGSDPLREALGEKETAGQELLGRKAGEITLGVILLAGLADGINPCVFSTLIFFISLLSVARVGGGKLLATGSVYCLACFIAYLALGFGLLKFLNYLKLFSAYGAIRSGIGYFMAAVLALLAVLSFMDAWRYCQTGESSAVSLRLPDRVKEIIHRVMKTGMSYKFLLPGIFLTGILVTGLEAVCTGQVYVPVLVFLARSPEGSASGIFYLVAYNLMFILPLLAVFAAAYFGAGTLRLVSWGKREMIIGKILMGAFFLILAAAIALM